MDLTKQENIDLLEDCCKVKELENTYNKNIASQNGKKELKKNNIQKVQEIQTLADSFAKKAYQFHVLNENITNNEDFDVEYEKKHYSHSQAIVDFLTEMETKNKHSIQSSYCKKADYLAKKINPTIQMNNRLHREFFYSHSNLKNKVKEQHKKYFIRGGATIAALITAGMLFGNHIKSAPQNHTTVKSTEETTQHNNSNNISLDKNNYEDER